MNRYLNIAFLQLSRKYKVNLVMFMNYSEEYKRVSKRYKLTISDKEGIEEKFMFETSSLRTLVSEMMKWL